MHEIRVRCGDCGEGLSKSTHLQVVERIPCPNCGSKTRQFGMVITEELQPKGQLKAKKKDPSRTGKQKTAIEIVTGDDLHRKSGNWFKKDRRIDRENNLYKETITDPETGAVIRHCEEQLDKHTGHGSAKGNDRGA